MLTNEPYYKVLPLLLFKSKMLFKIVKYIHLYKQNTFYGLN